MIFLILKIAVLWVAVAFLLYGLFYCLVKSGSDADNKEEEKNALQ